MPLLQCGMPAAGCATLGEAAAWCDRWLELQAGLGGRPAAVFDIDATLVARDERIEEVCALLERCLALRITPFLVTARSEEGRGFTEEQMQRLGVRGYKRLFMHPAHVDCDVAGAGRIKEQARTRIEEHGYTVCFNAGDAFHDHFHPPPPGLKHVLRPHAYSVFVTADGVAHLKLPG